MTSYFCNTVAIYVFFSLCSWRSLARDDDKNSKVLLTNDGPTTIGGRTILSAVVLNCPGANRYCWETSEGKNCSKLKKTETSLVVDNWSSPGKKTFTIIIEVAYPHYKECGQNTTVVVVTDTINAQLTVSPGPYHHHYFVGPVNISVPVHDPSHLFDPDKITYTWNFNDSTSPVINHLNKMIYNFTEDRVYSISVFITAHALGKLYNGTVAKTLPFKVNFSPALQVYNLHDHTPLSVLRLVPPTKDRVYVALGPVEFIIAYNDPYSLVKNVTTGWNFHDGPTFPHLPGNNISYNFTIVEDTYVWATPRFVTPNTNEVIPLLTLISVREPLTELNLTSNSSYTTKGDLQVNVTCQGSGPFQLCWKLFKKSHRPLFNNCSSLSGNCNFQINYTISYSGSYTLDVLVLNYVSSVNRIQHFTILGPTPKPHHNTAAKTASAVVPVIVCVIIIVFVLLFVAKKVYSSRHHSVLETADFDFRDEDNRSLDSFPVDNKCCHSFRFCRRFSKRKEKIPLLEDLGSSKASKSAMYSTIL
ncbi:uncharacterized protein LOC116295038 [Actinia tenebrosa]|uniref:Uncharacterized protein LOC116295038 n=1 Tax=Actinia tenebrosa TaxID=6105 RepID=A0A6P8I135_ACTTE|nr:uncharacterized protein LOC116295038 [Actinia tenebrosa]